MNAKLISAVLGTLAMSAPMMARADDAAAAKPMDDKKMATPAKKMKPAKKDTMAKKDSMAKDAKGGEKSCGADGKSCSGK